MAFENPVYEPNQDEFSIDDIKDYNRERVGTGVSSDEDEASVSDGSDIETPQGLTAKEKAAQEERLTLAKKESQAVGYLRLIFLIVLVLLGVALAYTVYRVIKRDQEKAFREQFDYYAE